MSWTCYVSGSAFTITPTPPSSTIMLVMKGHFITATISLYKGIGRLLVLLLLTGRIKRRTFVGTRRAKIDKQFVINFRAIFHRNGTQCEHAM